MADKIPVFSPKIDKPRGLSRYKLKLNLNGHKPRGSNPYKKQFGRFRKILKLQVGR